MTYTLWRVGRRRLPVTAAGPTVSIVKPVERISLAAITITWPGGLITMIAAGVSGLGGGGVMQALIAVSVSAAMSSTTGRGNVGL
jgi:hypothetical protein